MLLAARRLDLYSTSRWIPDLTTPKIAARNLRFAGAMILTIVGVGGLVSWDSDRESSAALQDLAQEQATLAKALGTSLGMPRPIHTSMGEDQVLARLRAVERQNSLVIFVHHPGESFLRATDGHDVISRRLIDALADGRSVTRIPRDEAAVFGLPSRTAFAGLERGDPSRGQTWDLIVIASAERERDRERWAWRRLVLGVLTAVGLVAVFGGLAMRNQRKELLLERELAIAGLQQSRDERLQRASKAAVMGTLAVGVAHEISTPLGVIAARAEQMGPKVAHDERLSAGVSTILAQIDRIKQVIRGLLGLARGDSPSAERIQPGTLVENAVGLVEHRFDKAGVRLVQRIAPDLPVVVGDPRLLEHALVNLLLNACEACKPPAEVTVSATKEGTTVNVTVDDPGHGISPADIGRALEPFFTTKARSGGTGLGLAIAHEIVASHRGTLVLSALTPHGTRAIIRLPAAEGSANG